MLARNYLCPKEVLFTRHKYTLRKIQTNVQLKYFPSENSISSRDTLQTAVTGKFLPFRTKTFLYQR